MSLQTVGQQLQQGLLTLIKQAVNPLFFSRLTPNDRAASAAAGTVRG